MAQNKFHPPQAIIFDLGGVLLDWNPRHLFKKMFTDNQAELDYFLECVCPPEWNTALDAGYSFKRAIEEKTIQFPEYQPYIHAYWTRWEEMIKGQFDQTVDILSQLKTQGYPLFVLSNWSAETYPLVSQRFEFLNWFDQIILSGEEKLVKPDPAFYQLLLRRINYQADQCLFIDDSKPNIEAANLLGFHTILFTSAENTTHQLQQLGIDIGPKDTN
jgi:2-haloacid dehalogenase